MKERGSLLVFAGLFLIVIFMSGVFGEQEKCSDSDKGINYNDKGAVTAVDEEKPYVDYCIGEETLVEFYCKEVKCSPEGTKKCKDNPINRIKRVVEVEAIQTCDDMFEGWKTFKKCESGEICKDVDGTHKCVKAPTDQKIVQRNPEEKGKFEMEHLVAFIPILGRVISRTEGESVVKSYEKSGITRFIEGIRMVLNSIGPDRGLPNINSKYVDYVRPAHKCASSEVCVAGACQSKNGCEAVSVGIGSASSYFPVPEKGGWLSIGPTDKKGLFGLTFGSALSLLTSDDPKAGENTIIETAFEASRQVKEQFEQDDNKQEGSDVVAWCPPPECAKDNCIVKTPDDVDDPKELLKLYQPLLEPIYDVGLTRKEYLCNKEPELKEVKASNLFYILNFRAGSKRIKGEYTTVAGLTFWDLWKQVDEVGVAFCKGVEDDEGNDCVWNTRPVSFDYKFSGTPENWDLDATAKGYVECVKKPDKWFIEGRIETTRKCVEETSLKDN